MGLLFPSSPPSCGENQHCACLSFQLTHTHTHSPLDSSGLQSQICLLFILPLKLITKYCCSDYNISLNHQLPAVTGIIFQLEYKDHCNCPNSAHHTGI